MARTPGGTLSGFNLLQTPGSPTLVFPLPYSQNGIAETSGSASIKFDAPLDVQGTSYTVSLIDQSTGESTSNTGSSSPITVTPSSGGSFNVTVQGFNSYGPGRIANGSTSIYTGNQLWAWGANSSGQLGDDTAITKSSPIQVGALTTWQQVSAGGTHCLAVKTDNTLWAWGANSSGQLGLNAVTVKSSPTQVGALSDWSHANCGSNHSLAIKTNGTLWAWGLNTNGQVGDGSTVSKSSPVQIGVLTTWSKVAGGSTHSLGLAGSSLLAWGQNNSGQLGDKTPAQRTAPVTVYVKTDFNALGWFSAGTAFSQSVTSAGLLWGWGDGGEGQLGTNRSDEPSSGFIYNLSSPVQVGSGEDMWLSVSSGSNHSATIRTDRSLWTFGSNSSGQLGLVDTTLRSSPVQVGSDFSWQTVSAGTLFNVAIRNDGTMWAWGSNSSGRLGDQTTVAKSSPIQVGSLSNWRQVSAGNGFSAALYGVTS